MTRVVVRCSNGSCRQRLRLPAERVGPVVCSRCGTRFEAETVRSVWPAMAVTIAVALVWFGLILAPATRIADAASVFWISAICAAVCAGATALMRERPFDSKLTEYAATGFAIMAVTGLVFVFVAAWINSQGALDARSASLASVARIKGLLNGIERAQDFFKLTGVTFLAGALVAVALAVVGLNRWSLRASKGLRAAPGWLTPVGLVFLSVGSLQICVASTELDLAAPRSRLAAVEVNLDNAFRTLDDRVHLIAVEKATAAVVRLIEKKAAAAAVSGAEPTRTSDDAQPVRRVGADGQVFDAFARAARQARAVDRCQSNARQLAHDDPLNTNVVAAQRLGIMTRGDPEDVCAAAFVFSRGAVFHAVEGRRADGRDDDDVGPTPPWPNPRGFAEAGAALQAMQSSAPSAGASLTLAALRSAGAAATFSEIDAVSESLCPQASCTQDTTPDALVEAVRTTVGAAIGLFGLPGVDVPGGLGDFVGALVGKAANKPIRDRLANDLGLLAQEIVSTCLRAAEGCRAAAEERVSRFAEAAAGSIVDDAIVAHAARAAREVQRADAYFAGEQRRLNAANRPAMRRAIARATSSRTRAAAGAPLACDGGACRPWEAILDMLQGKQPHTRAGDIAGLAEIFDRMSPEQRARYFASRGQGDSFELGGLPREALLMGRACGINCAGMNSSLLPKAYYYEAPPYKPVPRVSFWGGVRQAMMRPRFLIIP